MDASIAEHLRAMLNTRRGNAETVPDYGVVDFADVVHGMPGSVALLEASIRDVVRRYEPRLRGASVRRIASDDPFRLCFEISARLSDGSGTLRFCTHLRAGGQFDVDVRGQGLSR